MKTKNKINNNEKSIDSELVKKNENIRNETNNQRIDTSLKQLIEKKNEQSLKTHTINYDEIDEKDYDEFIFTDNSFFIFSSKNSFRKICQKIFLNEFFEVLILFIIILNSIILILEINNHPYYIIDLFFLVTFFLEFCIKSIALGLIIGKNTYLRDFWNCLDFLVLVSSFLDFIIGTNFAPLRLFRLIKLFTTINLFPHFARFIEIFIDSFYHLFYIYFFLFISTLIFSIIGFSFFNSRFEYLCRLNEEPINGILEINELFKDTLCGGENKCNNKINLCLSSKKLKKENTYLMINIQDEISNENFNYGITNFDNVLKSFLIVFISISKSGWSVFMKLMIDGYNYYASILFFVLCIIVNNFFFMKLIIAAVFQKFEKYENRENKYILVKKIFLKKSTVYAIKNFSKKKRLEIYYKQYPLIQSRKISNSKRFKNFVDLFSKKNYKYICLKKIDKQKNHHNTCFIGYYCYLIYNQPFVKCIFMIIILINLIILTLKIENYPNNISNIFKYINLGIVYIFLIEQLLFLIGEGINFFKNIMNIFDFIIVIGSIIELNLKITNNYESKSSIISTLRIFQFFRYLEIFDILKKFQIILTSMAYTAIRILDFIFFFFLVIFIFSLLGCFLFKNTMKIDSNGNFSADNESYPFNFDDLSNAFLSTFMIILGESWEKIFYQCYKSPNNNVLKVLFYFFFLVIFGQFSMMNSFAAYLIGSFSYSYNSLIKNEYVKNNLLYLFLGITRIYQFDKTFSKSKKNQSINEVFRQFIIFSNRKRITTPGHLVLIGKSKIDFIKRQFKVYEDYLSIHNKKNLVNKKEINLKDLYENGKYCDKQIKDFKFYEFEIDYNKIYNTMKKRNLIIMNNQDLVEMKISNLFSNPSNLNQIIYDNHLKKKIKKKNKSKEIQKIIEKSTCEKIIVYCKESSLFIFHRESNFRKNIKTMIHSKEFNYIIYLLIVINIIIICIDNEWIIENSRQEYFIKGVSMFLNCVFFIEGILRIISDGLIINPKLDSKMNLKSNGTFEEIMNEIDYSNTVNVNFDQLNDQEKKEVIKKGFIEIKNRKAYLRKLKYQIDFLCILIGIIDLTGIMNSNKYLRILKSLRTLKVIRLLTKSKRILLMTKTVFECVPAIGILITIILINLYIYSIFSMNLFKDKFTYYCQEFPFIKDKETCNNQGGNWIYNYENFHNFLFSLKTNFIILYGHDWSNLMYFYWEISKNALTYLFFISLIIIGNIYILNISISFLFQKYRELKNNTYDYFDLTKEEIEWLNLQKYIMKFKPYQKDKENKKKWRIKLGTIIESNYFNYFIFIIIILSTIIIIIQYSGENKTYKYILDGFSLFFTLLFNFEMIIKMLFYGCSFFRKFWNIYDLVIVIICDIIMVVKIFTYNNIINVDLLTTFPIIFRFLRIFKTFRIISISEILRQLMDSIYQILSNIAYFSIIIISIIIIYGNIGMNIFGTVPYKDKITNSNNFRGFIPSILVLFRVSTGEDWYQIMNELAYHDCKDPNSDNYKKDYYCINYNIKCFDKFYIDRDKKNEMEELISSSDSYNTYNIEYDSDIYQFTCGSNFSYFYFISYVLICPILLMNLLVMQIIEGYINSVSHHDLQMNEKYINNFIELWGEYDPYGNLKILPHEFVLIFKQLTPPFGLLYDRKLYSNPLKYERFRNQYNIFNRVLSNDYVKDNTDINFNEKGFFRSNSKLPYGYQFTNFYISKNKKFYTNDLEVSRILEYLNLTAFPDKSNIFFNKQSYTFSNSIIAEEEEKLIKKKEINYIHYVDACLAITKYAISKSQNVDISTLRDKKVNSYTMNYWYEYYDSSDINKIFYSKNFYEQENKISKIIANNSLIRIKHIIQKKIQENPTITESIWVRNKLIKRFEPFIAPYIDNLIRHKKKNNYKVIYYRSTIRGTLFLISYKALIRK